MPNGAAASHVSSQPGAELPGDDAPAGDRLIGTQPARPVEFIRDDAPDGDRLTGAEPVMHAVQPDGQHDVPDRLHEQPLELHPQAEEAASSSAPAPSRPAKAALPSDEPWWTCPWCPFKVFQTDERLCSSSRSENHKTRLRKKHLAEEHCDKDPDDSSAALAKRNPEARMNTIMDARIANIKLFITKTSKHKLEYVSGFTILCNRCKYKGTTKNLPARCTLQRGGKRLGASQLAPQAMPKDGFCLWHSLAAFVGKDFAWIRDKICDEMDDDKGLIHYQGISHLEWIRLENDHHDWETYVSELRTGA
eukprot:11399136-Heterocapsa_arctica.AAC.1